MKCKVCGTLNHNKDDRKIAQRTIFPGVYISLPPAYFCMTCAALISKAFMQLTKAGAVGRELALASFPDTSECAWSWSPEKTSTTIDLAKFFGHPDDKATITFKHGTLEIVPTSMKILSKKRIKAKKAILARKVNAGIKEIIEKRVRRT